MKKLRNLSVILMLLLCHKGVTAQESSDDFDQLIEWITGEFSSKEQAKKNSSFKDYTLRMIQIWPEATTGAWIYVEKFPASAPDNPVSQCIYFISEINESQFSMDEYKIPKEEKFIGAWKKPEIFKGMTAFDLKYSDGCTLFLDYDGFQYAGATNAETCKSDEADAAYRLSKITLLPNEIRVLEKVFSAEGNQVSGEPGEPYLYKKE